MRLKVLFALRKGMEYPEALVVVNELVDEHNPDWFAGKRARVLKAMGNKLEAHAVVTIQVWDADILERLGKGAPVKGRIKA